MAVLIFAEISQKTFSYPYICRVTFMSAEKYNVKTKKFKGDSYGEKSEKTDYITFKRYAW